VKTPEKLQQYLSEMNIDTSIPEEQLEKKKEEVRVQRSKSIMRRKVLEEEAEKFWREQQELERRLSAEDITSVDSVQDSIFENPPVDLIQVSEKKQRKVEFAEDAPIEKSPRLSTKTVLNKYLEDMKINLPKKDQVIDHERRENSMESKKVMNEEEERFWKAQVWLIVRKKLTFYRKKGCSNNQ
jgi:hypothetical protein